MTSALAAPTPELARRILAGVTYRDRIPAGRLTSRLGITRGSVRGLPELHRYLTPDDRTLPAIDLARLADWMEHVIADAELARQTRAAHADAPCYVDACIAVHELVGQRLAQARGALAGADAAAEPRP